MNCPHCKTVTKTTVKETRLRDGDIVRSRSCGSCGKVFGTREAHDSTLLVGTGKGNSPASLAALRKPIDLLKVWR